MSKPGASRMCPDCTSMRADSVCHMLFECTSLSNVRAVYWDCVVACTPRVLMTEIMSMATESKSKFILSGLRVFTCEWLNVYEALARFMCEMYLYL